MFVDLGIVLVIIGIITTAANRWLFGEYLCSIHGEFSFFAHFMRIILMFTLVIDRFLTVFIPYKYPKYRLKVMCTLSLMVWRICVCYYAPQTL